MIESHITLPMNNQYMRDLRKGRTCCMKRLRVEKKIIYPKKEKGEKESLMKTAS